MSLYRQIAAQLRAQIESGEIGPGERLPPETKLMAQYTAGRNTVRLATALLRNEGLVKAVPGRSGGIFVRDRRVLTFHAVKAEDPGAPYAETDAWHADVQAQGLVPEQRFECRMVRLPADIAARLGEEPSASAVLRRCVRLVDGHPSSVQDSYYPRWLSNEVPELLSPENIPIGTTRLLADRGHVQVGYLDHVSARMPTPDEVKLLDLIDGTPVLIKIRTACTRDRAVRVTTEVMAAHSNQIEYEIGDVSAARA